MTVLSTPIKNEMAMQKDLFRFSAALFSETSNEFSSLDSQLQMIKCLFAKNDNEPMTEEEIAVNLLDIYKYHISVDEVDGIIKGHKKTFETVFVDDSVYYKLLESVLASIQEAQKNNIDSYIKRFVEEFDITDNDMCSNAIYAYLYELTTTNINTYRLLISGKNEQKLNDNELSVDISYLSSVEQQYVHDFISWDDGDKNIALTNIVFTCLEYCLLVNGDKPNKLINKSIRKREIYIDTNIIFRALGINGPIRQRTVKSFLEKCKQAKLKLIISHNTKREFFDTINYYLEQIHKYPRGNIYAGAYEQLTDYTLFNYYEDWRKDHPAMSMLYFKMFIQSSYEKMVKEYGISDGEKIPRTIYDSEQFKQARNIYSSTIKNIKDELHDRYVSEDDRYSLKDSHDATVVRYVEMRREETQDTDIFFVSSDKILRYWDLSRPDKEYPVIIYPSQLFLVLIKTCGRSENDFESFVSFINVRSVHQQMPAEKANVIISGISTITEDIEAQEILVTAICNGEYQNILRDSQNNDELYIAVQEVCKKYLEEELKEKQNQITSLQENADINTKRILTLEENAISHEKEITLLRGQVEKQASDMDKRDKLIEQQSQQINAQNKTSEEHKEQICCFAEKKIRTKLVFKWYIFPIITAILAISYILFVLLQFIACEAPWNVATKIVAAIEGTTFGQNVEGYVAVVDSALFVVLSTIIAPNFWVKPWDKEKRNADKLRMVESYIEKNKLL